MLATDEAEALYREHFAFVWRNARRLGCSDEWVDDAVHEVFLVATRRLAEFRGASSLRTWLFAITFRVVGRMQRDRARRRDRVNRYALERPAPIADAARETEAAQYLRQLLLRLSEPQRAVLILAELEGFTSSEISETLGVPAGTVDSRLRAARSQLSRAIERDRITDKRRLR
jgi:RNA polymerase sigma-70 factor (ECF subfamily)